MQHNRYMAALVFAAFLLLAGGINAGAVSGPVGLSRIEGLSVIERVQDKPKSETVKQKVKRIWRNMTGYKFDVACPAFALALSRTSCTTTGKNREDARAKCQSQHVLCEVRDAR